MTDGQWRVFGLLIILLILEGIANLNGIKAFFNGLVFNPFKQAIQAPQTSSSGSGSTPQNQFQTPQTVGGTGVG